MPRAIRNVSAKWPAASSRPNFVEVASAPAECGPADVFELAFSDGRVLRIPAEFDPDALRALLVILDEER